jgi:hypothetical protein
MFLLTRIEGVVSFTELLALSGCDTVDTMQRVERLAGLGLLQTEGHSLEPGAHALDDGDHDEITATMEAPRGSALDLVNRVCTQAPAARKSARPSGDDG